MTTAAINPVIPVERTWKSWLFNPFKFVAGFKALILGLVFIVGASLLGYLGSIHFDGVLDMHPGPAWPAWVFIAEGIIDWLSLALVLTIFAAIMWRSTSRSIDVIGTQALARWPSLITVLLPQCGGYTRIINDLVAKMQQSPMAPPALNPVDMIILLVISILLLAAIVWMVALMYRAFAVSCNAKGTKAVMVFIVAIIVGEVISKVLISMMASKI